jgi:hypothetical protein
VADIKAAIQRADVQILGNDTLDGRPATHLRFTYQAAGETVHGDAWFDSQTYAPLRATTTYDAPSSASQQPPQATASAPLANGSTSRVAPLGPVSETTSFLPRTAANVTQARLTISDGFTQVPPPSH